MTVDSKISPLLTNYLLSFNLPLPAPALVVDQYVLYETTSRFLHLACHTDITLWQNTQIRFPKSILTEMSVHT